jgi:hypothetical protein
MISITFFSFVETREKNKKKTKIMKVKVDYYRVGGKREKVEGGGRMKKSSRKSEPFLYWLFYKIRSCFRPSRPGL